jgi:hypothetical protein
VNINNKLQLKSFGSPVSTDAPASVLPENKTNRLCPSSEKITDTRTGTDKDGTEVGGLVAPTTVGSKVGLTEGEKVGLYEGDTKG